jgi:hypothetical protein
MFLFYIWCVSVAGDVKSYIVAAADKDAAFETIPPFLRWDWSIHYANHTECRKLGVKFDDEHTVVFEDKFFEYNKEKRRFEMDCFVNYNVRPDLLTK